MPQIEPSLNASDGCGGDRHFSPQISKRDGHLSLGSFALNYSKRTFIVRGFECCQPLKWCSLQSGLSFLDS